MRSPSSAQLSLPAVGRYACHEAHISTHEVARAECAYEVGVCDTYAGVLNKMANMFAGGFVICGIVFHEIFAMLNLPYPLLCRASDYASSSSRGTQALSARARAGGGGGGGVGGGDSQSHSEGRLPLRNLWVLYALLCVHTLLVFITVAACMARVYDTGNDFWSVIESIVAAFLVLDIDDKALPFIRHKVLARARKQRRGLTMQKVRRTVATIKVTQMFRLGISSGNSGGGGGSLLPVASDGAARPQPATTRSRRPSSSGPSAAAPVRRTVTVSSCDDGKLERRFAGISGSTLPLAVQTSSRSDVVCSCPHMCCSLLRRSWRSVIRQGRASFCDRHRPVLPDRQPAEPGGSGSGRLCCPTRPSGRLRTHRCDVCPLLGRHACARGSSVCQLLRPWRSSSTQAGPATGGHGGGTVVIVYHVVGVKGDSIVTSLCVLQLLLCCPVMYSSWNVCVDVSPALRPPRPALTDPWPHARAVQQPLITESYARALRLSLCVCVWPWLPWGFVSAWYGAGCPDLGAD
jgi:hypothetical protein